MLLVTIRDTESEHSLVSGKWMQVTKLQSQRKSLSTPEEPYALDILIITMQVRGRGLNISAAQGVELGPHCALKWEGPSLSHVGQGRSLKYTLQLKGWSLVFTVQLSGRGLVFLMQIGTELS